MRRRAALRDARLAAVSATFKSATIVRKSLSSHGPAIFSCQTIGDLLREPIAPLDVARLAQLLAKCSHEICAGIWWTRIEVSITSINAHLRLPCHSDTIEARITQPEPVILILARWQGSAGGN